MRAFRRPRRLAGADLPMGVSKPGAGAGPSSVHATARVDAAGLVSSPFAGMGLEPLVGTGLEPLGHRACAGRWPLSAATIGLLERSLALLLSVSKRTVRSGVLFSLLGAGDDVSPEKLDDRKMQKE